MQSHIKALSHISTQFKFLKSFWDSLYSISNKDVMMMQTNITNWWHQLFSPSNVLSSIFMSPNACFMKSQVSCHFSYSQTGADKAWDWWVTNAADLSDDNWQIIVVSNVGMKIMEKICKVRSRSGWFFEIRLLWEMISSYFSCRVLNVCYGKIYVFQLM